MQSVCNISVIKAKSKHVKCYTERLFNMATPNMRNIVLPTFFHTLEHSHTQISSLYIKIVSVLTVVNVLFFRLTPKIRMLIVLCHIKGRVPFKLSWVWIMHAINYPNSNQPQPVTDPLKLVIIYIANLTLQTSYQFFDLHNLYFVPSRRTPRHTYLLFNSVLQCILCWSKCFLVMQR